jgi:hypothetical protein
LHSEMSTLGQREAGFGLFISPARTQLSFAPDIWADIAHLGAITRFRIGFALSFWGKGVATPRSHKTDRWFGRCMAVGGARAAGT